MAGPFAGLKVLELGRFIAVPVCGQMLAEGGADVVKVEDLDGDQTRHNGAILPFEGRQFFNKNRGKRSLCVDLHDRDALRAVQAIAAQADIVLANFRPGSAEKLGLDYESVRRSNPRIIYGENTAYGLEGPLAHLAGMDVAVQARTGLAHFSADGPEPFLNPMIDYSTAMLMATAGPTNRSMTTTRTQWLPGRNRVRCCLVGQVSFCSQWQSFRTPCRRSLLSLLPMYSIRAA